MKVLEVLQFDSQMRIYRQSRKPQEKMGQFLTSPFGRQKLAFSPDAHARSGRILAGPQYPPARA